MLKMTGQLVLTMGLLGAAYEASVAAPAGDKIYQQQCARCHGAKGEGVLESYPHALVGELSVGELTRYIEKSMPEDKPGSCTGEDARAVAQFMHEAFYSPTAQVRNKPVRIELSRLTVRQYRQVIADVLGSFRGATKVEPTSGLKGEYFKSRNFRREARELERVDPVVAFNFEDKSPVPEKIDPHEFSIRWQGAVTAPDSGAYDFIVRTDQAVRLWVNSRQQPLVDAYVKSGKDTEHRGSISLLAGRTYLLDLEFSKANQGVDDKKAKEKPPAPAFVSLEWVRPQRVAEVLPARALSVSRPAEQFVLTTPFPPDDRSVGWEKATSISKEWDQATTSAAIEVANYVVARYEELAGTKRSAADRDEKLKNFCRRFAERAFRRPLTAEQQQVFVDRHFATSSEPNAAALDPEIALKRCLLLILKSPRFLYREVGETEVALDDFSTASRLSFALYDSLPDQGLLDAASKGELKTEEQRQRQAERLINDPRTKAKLRDFLLTWLKVEHVPDVSKDPERFPDFNAALANDLRTSLELSIDELLTSPQADFRQLLASDALYLNGRLAKFYGADLPAESDFQKVALDPQERAGVLSHPYLMSGFAYTATSSPIHRGVFIARSVLGRSLRQPPEAVAPLAPHLKPELTTRERVALQTKPEVCQSCHAMLNPLGFTLEHFDAVGRFRKEENGRTVDSSGLYRTRQGETVKFGGVRDLADFLVKSDETHAAFVEQLFQFLVKQPIRAYGPSVRETLRRDFVASDFNVRQLAVRIVTTSSGVSGGTAR